MTEEKPKTKTLRLAVWAVGLLVVFFGGLLFLYGISKYSGTEFCPDTFSMRTFSYRKMPFTGWVISGIQYNDNKNFVGETLVADKWIMATPEKQWDLVSESASLFSAGVSDQCDARFLINDLSQYEYDQATSSSKSRWLGWSDKHDACAGVFWPRIAKLARLKMYLAIPELMEFARHNAVQDDDPKADKQAIKQEVAEFSTELDRQSAAALVRFAEVDEANGNKSRALARYRAAAKIDNHPAAITARDRLVGEGVSESQ